MKSPRERWKVVTQFPSYEVSSNGRLRRTFKGFKRVINGYLGNGRKFYTMRGDNTRRQVEASRLVAEVFIPNPKDYSIVKHIDGDTLNDRLENLEWSGNTGDARTMIKIQRMKLNK